MGRIFVGLCQVGAWGCFDEFNRLEERMLSAVSQQVQCIQEALREHSNPNYDKSKARTHAGMGGHRLTTWAVLRAGADPPRSGGSWPPQAASCLPCPREPIPPAIRFRE